MNEKYFAILSYSQMALGLFSNIAQLKPRRDPANARTTIHIHIHLHPLTFILYWTASRPVVKHA